MTLVCYPTFSEMGLWFCQPACRQASAQGGVIFIGKDDNGNVAGAADNKRMN